MIGAGVETNRDKRDEYLDQDASSSRGVGTQATHLTSLVVQVLVVQVLVVQVLVAQVLDVQATWLAAKVMRATLLCADGSTRQLAAQEQRSAVQCSAAYSAVRRTVQCSVQCSAVPGPASVAWRIQDMLDRAARQCRLLWHQLARHAPLPPVTDRYPRIIATATTTAPEPMPAGTLIYAQDICIPLALPLSHSPTMPPGLSHVASWFESGQP
ncbi:hypothetical protein CDD82_914 [Ophiocordyceps australis]|uniref:Uncharacterized protein n=1 Tax=Ophiocordyceps australis TaxID=1399860 RepID=A0A2C5ZK06_9HYPO|nr:hypothetical protein CDD82_914 [Ophiocordyceps australis]